METSSRFNNAVTKLYNAFHNGELNAFDCQKCAVGNIVGDMNIADDYRLWFKKYWRSGVSGDMTLDQHLLAIKPSETQVYDTQYTVKELMNVERLFISCFTSRLSSYKEEQFKGLCAVVEYLCELEGIPNVMDYTKLFETENDTPAYKLETVLS